MDLIGSLACAVDTGPHTNTITIWITILLLCDHH